MRQIAFKFPDHKKCLQTNQANVGDNRCHRHAGLFEVFSCQCVKANT